MKERARPFWWPEEVSDAASARPEIEACREWTPFLTALFDGEADEQEALAARRHLLVCERCARAWLDWNQTRHLFLQLAEPPAPPPNLLWRVILACRLGAQPTAAPELSAQILERTSRRAARPSAPMWATRSPRLVAAFPGALALCGFALFMAHGALVSSPMPLAPDADSPLGTSVNLTATPNTARALAVSTDAELPILPLREARAEAAPRLTSAAPNAPRADSGADETLLRARRELQELPLRVIPVALPMNEHAASDVARNAAPLEKSRAPPSRARRALGPRRADSPLRRVTSAVGIALRRVGERPRVFVRDCPVARRPRAARVAGFFFRGAAPHFPRRAPAPSPSRSPSPPMIPPWTNSIRPCRNIAPRSLTRRMAMGADAKSNVERVCGVV